MKWQLPFVRLSIAMYNAMLSSRRLSCLGLVPVWASVDRLPLAERGDKYRAEVSSQSDV